MRRLLPLLFLPLLMPVHAATVTTFAAPDSSFAVVQGFIAAANETLSLSTYTFDHARITDELVSARKRSVAVTVLAEANPVGGLQNESKAVFCELAKNGIPVHLHTGKTLIHAKYAIRDNASVLVSTENFGYDGYPANGYGNRGWGAVVDDAGMAQEALSIYESDLRDAVLFACTRSSYSVRSAASNFVVPPRFLPRSFYNQSVQLIAAPGAVDDIIGLIASAHDTLLVEQFYVYRNWGTKKEPEPNAFLEAAISRARNGTDVKLLLDSTWYNVEERDQNDNDDVVAYVNDIARNESLPLEAKLADTERIGAEKIHAKGIVADNRVLISSINWNEASPTRNRELGIVVEGEAANYFREVFASDWEPRAGGATGKATEKPSGIGSVLIIVIVLIALAAVLVVARRGR
ncbi:MAG: hypothetical protein HYY37_03190 [Candidatus Aenigmarchaeota archaeon]|nr:hypothetical protein [Candidatus Aenigmarchaeota archaeon]